MTEYDNNVKLGWDDQIEDIPKEEFVVLKPGQYHFKVTGMKRMEWDKGKYQGCRYAELDLTFTGDDGEEGYGTDKLTLHSKFSWKLRQFFHSIGCVVEKGKPLVPNWNIVIGAEGRCTVRNSSYTSSKDGKTYVNNDVAAYIEPAEELDADGAIPF